MPLCPRCKANLDRNGEALVCTECGSVYPVENRIIRFLDSMPLGEQDRKIKNRYDTIAPTYDSAIVSIIESSGCAWVSYIKKLENYLYGTKNSIILDIGSGTSFPVGSLINDSIIYLGLDFSIGMLRIAQELLDLNIHATFFNIDSFHIPLNDSSVDMCLMLHTINSASDNERIASEIKRVLKSNGSCLLSVIVNLGENSRKILGSSLSNKEAESLIELLFNRGWVIEKSNCGNILFYLIKKKIL